MHPESSKYFYRFSKSWSYPGSDYGLYRRSHWHRRPSRLLWFGIGAASATVYIMHKEAEQSGRANYWKNCYRPPVQQSQPQTGGGFSQVLADPLPTILGSGSGAPPTPSPYPYSHPHHHSHWSWGFAKDRTFQYPPPPRVPPASGIVNDNANVSAYGQVPSDSVRRIASTESLSVPTPTPVVPSSAPAVQTQAVPWGFESKFEQQKKEWEQERANLLAKAHDTMTELSESTLDSLSSTVEALKTKLAEHRFKREEQQKLVEKELEEQKQKPIRYV
ncbi:hypothetical protein J3R30DRAFT_3707792 [Lentinula aciculospora]|uniref:Uncharacterized protein n=1 Tax=Lentinula aciculospora TaxID=153920 RepID=A0A9W9A3R8_9AGAR|nr:hypothetical protein J3R30DRAFT_3707792 [Lentinula aciculospora]